MSGVLREKLIVRSVSQEIPAIHGTQRFITVFTIVATDPYKPDESNPRPPPIFRRSILILFFYLSLGSPSSLFPSNFATKISYAFLTLNMRATCTVFLVFLDLIVLIIFNIFKWALCLHGKARPQVADSREGLQIWRVATNTLNK
jgi:hypothetical protein